MTTTAERGELSDEAIDLDEPRIDFSDDGARRAHPAARLPDGRSSPTCSAPAVGSFCLTWLVYERLTPLSGGLGFVVVWYVLFLTTVWFIVARATRRAARARSHRRASSSATVAVGMLIPLGLIVGYTIARGYPRVAARSSSSRTRATSGR